MDAKEERSSNKDSGQCVKFITEKSESFRTFHADGVWGMSNNAKNIQLNFFIEHYALPEAVVYSVDKNGNLEEQTEVIREKDDRYYYTVVRDYQAAVVMSLDTAKDIHTVLGNFIKLCEDS